MKLVNKSSSILSPHLMSSQTGLSLPQFTVTNAAEKQNVPLWPRLAYLPPSAQTFSQSGPTLEEYEQI